MARERDCVELFVNPNFRKHYLEELHRELAEAVKDSALLDALLKGGVAMLDHLGERQFVTTRDEIRAVLAEGEERDGKA